MIRSDDKTTPQPQSLQEESNHLTENIPHEALQEQSGNLKNTTPDDDKPPPYSVAVSTPYYPVSNPPDWETKDTAPPYSIHPPQVGFTESTLLTDQVPTAPPLTTESFNSHRNDESIPPPPYKSTFA